LTQKLSSGKDGPNLRGHTMMIKITGDPNEMNGKQSKNNRSTGYYQVSDVHEVLTTGMHIVAILLL
jgi:hypothetical protein